MTRISGGKMKKTKKRILTACIISATVISLAAVWFRIPYSPMKAEFERDVTRLAADEGYDAADRVITEESIAHLPQAVQDYIRHCGYIGTPAVKYMTIDFHDVDFRQGKDGPALTIDYTQYNFTAKPCRMAFIDTYMFGIPFQGYDYYEDGKGGMKGVLAKGITLFDERGTDMDRSCLVTYLAESFCCPSIFLEDFITFEEVDRDRVRARISYAGQTAEGTFVFGDDSEIIAFTTEERGLSGTDGTVEYIPWTVRCSDYAPSADGILHPTKMQAIWNYPEGDFVYFDGEMKEIIYK